MNLPLQKIAGVSASLLVLLLSLAVVPIRPGVLGLSFHGTDLGLGKAKIKSSSGHRRYAVKTQATIRRRAKKASEKTAKSVSTAREDQDFASAGFSKKVWQDKTQEVVLQKLRGEATNDPAASLVGDAENYVTDKDNPLDLLDAYQTNGRNGGGQKPPFPVLYASNPQWSAHPHHPRLPAAAAPVPPTSQNAAKAAATAHGKLLGQALLAARSVQPAAGAAGEAAPPAGDDAGAPPAAPAGDAAGDAGVTAPAQGAGGAVAAAPSAAAPSAAAAPPTNNTNTKNTAAEKNQTNNSTNTSNGTETSTKPCVTRLEGRATAAWTLFVTLSPPDTPCVFGVDPRDEGGHCIEEEDDFYGSYGWCYTAADASSWGSCSMDCPLYGHLGKLGKKVNTIETGVDGIMEDIENGALDDETDSPGEPDEMPFAAAPMFAAAPAAGLAAAPAAAASGGAAGGELAAAPA